ncbi:MAG: pyrimidine dimer DNA glycosylase/endonuclease V [Bacillaceae bacterium]
MRLWHTEIIKYLPKGQLLAQWRELNSVFAKEDKHVLINYIYEYGKEDLYAYTQVVLNEMERRGYKIRTVDKMNNYFQGISEVNCQTPYSLHHNDEYLEICYFNLKEKFIRGQKDYDEKLYKELCSYIKNKLYK